MKLLGGLRVGVVVLLVMFVLLPHWIHAEENEKKITESEEYQLIEEVLGRVDHYDTLLLPQTASSGEIKKAFYKLSMKYHPDKIKASEQSEESEAKFLQVARAYEVLSSSTLRSAYDNFRDNGVPWEKRYYGRWAHYYGAPSHDLHTVVLVVITITTLLHWLLRYQRYHRVVGYAKRTEVYQKRVQEIQAQGGNPEEIKVEFSGLQPPSWRDLLPVILVRGVYQVVSYWAWYLIWIKLLGHYYDRDADMAQRYNMTKEEFLEAKARYEEQMEQKKNSAKAKRYRRLMRRYKAGTLH